MRLEFGIGNGSQWVDVPDANVIDILMPNEVAIDISGVAAVKRALSQPIGLKRLKDIVQPGESVAIVTSDITRPMPTSLVLPPLLSELDAAGVQKGDIRLVFGLGSHRRHTEAEMKKLAGEKVYEQIHCEDSTPEDCVHFGHTQRGTPVDIARSVAQADRRICLGNIEYHYFAGYSGGGKALMPGVSTREAISKNHSLMTRLEACAGRIEGNPIREDIDEAASIVGIDFLLNVVLNEQKQVVYAVAGDSILAHRDGCRFLDRFYLKEIDAQADIVIVSQGGMPKDLNLYQTQKALDNAKHAVKPGGVIILVGSCREGLGEATFEEWMTCAPSSESMIERIQKDFQLGGHKAAAIAMVLQDADIYLVSELEDSFVSRLFLKPYATVQSALDAAFEKLGPKATVIAMPYGGSTLPRINKKG